MREIVLEEDAVRLGEQRGWLVRKITYPGRKGAPDRHFYKAGRCVMIEFKASQKGPRVQQDKEHKRLKEAGFTVHIVDSWEAFNALIT
jgi:hypothetical protein